MQSGLSKAIHYFGSQQSLAQAIGVRQQAISHWIHRGQIPCRQVLKIVHATKWIVTPHELNPHDTEINSIFEELIKTYRKKHQTQAVK